MYCWRMKTGHVPRTNIKPVKTFIMGKKGRFRSNSHCTSNNSYKHEHNMCMHSNDSEGTGALNGMDWDIVNICAYTAVSHTVSEGVH
jgi:hypothetical protein